MQIVSESESLILVYANNISPKKGAILGLLGVTISHAKGLNYDVKGSAHVHSTVTKCLLMLPSSELKVGMILWLITRSDGDKDLINKLIIKADIL